MRLCHMLSLVCRHTALRLCHMLSLVCRHTALRLCHMLSLVCRHTALRLCHMLSAVYRHTALRLSRALCCMRARVIQIVPHAMHRCIFRSSHLLLVCKHVALHLYEVLYTVYRNVALRLCHVAICKCRI